MKSNRSYTCLTKTTFKKYYEKHARADLYYDTSCPDFIRYDRGKYEPLSVERKKEEQMKMWEDNKEILLFAECRDCNGKYTALYTLDDFRLCKEKKDQMYRVIHKLLGE